MQNELPRFKLSLRTKKRQAYEYFLLEDDELQNTTYDDYVLLRRWVKQEPIVGLIAELFGAKLIKRKETP